MKNKYLFTSESVTEGHPDKMCDLISDAILDEILKQDPDGRVACETFCTTGQINIMGEISADYNFSIPKIVREVINDIGYNSSEQGFDGNTCAINISLDEQSPDIAMGIKRSYQNIDANLQGAGDQGVMFGYACDETPELMPMAISIAHKLVRRLTEVRKDGLLPYLCPDGKSQVTVEYVDGKCNRIDSIVISAQHQPNVDINVVRFDILEKVIKVVVKENLLDHQTKIYINPTGRFVVGGPQADTGLTGRKIIVDTYGGYARHGGGAFSGKDPSKVDRSAAYMARYVAKNVVASGLAQKCEVQIAYAIGVARPVSIMIDTFGTGICPDVEISKAVRATFDFRPKAIIDTLGLQQPIYKSLATYGHVGREDLEVKWECTDKVDELLSHIKDF